MLQCNNNNNIIMDGITAVLWAYSEPCMRMVKWLFPIMHLTQRCSYNIHWNTKIVIVPIHNCHQNDFSAAKCKTAVAPLLTQWSYCSLALSHRSVIQWLSVIITEKQTSCPCQLLRLSDQESYGSDCQTHQLPHMLKNELCLCSDVSCRNPTRRLADLLSVRKRTKQLAHNLHNLSWKTLDMFSSHTFLSDANFVLCLIANKNK